MSAGRRFAAVLVVLGFGALGVLVSYGATWVLALVPVFAGTDGGAAPAREVALSGRDLAPLGGAMGWVGLAAIAALLATRTWGRRVTGGVVVVAGGVAGVTALAFALTDVASGGAGAFITAALGPTDAGATSVSISAWWVLAMVSGLALVACGLLALLDGPSWPRLGARYSRPDGQAGAPSAAAAWDALDRGEDPTLEPQDSRDPDPGSMGNAAPDTRTQEER